MSEAPTATVRVVVHGTVQGVGYRAWVEARARKLGLEGWVRNRCDDTVEAVFSGPKHAVSAMVADCGRGPPLARVTQVENAPADTNLLTQRLSGERFSIIAKV
jgi:acylphosphatase